MKAAAICLIRVMIFATIRPTASAGVYAGSGPSQLALAILADVLDDDALANKLHIDFKNKVIARLDGDRWTLSEEDVRLAVADFWRWRRGGEPGG